MATTRAQFGQRALKLKETAAGVDALDDRDVLLTRRETAIYLRKSVPTLERWAREGFGPKPVIIGRSALYRLTDLRAFTGADTRRPA